MAEYFNGLNSFRVSERGTLNVAEERNTHIKPKCSV
jgi:hypothetical protein